MGMALMTWLASQGASLILGFVAQVITSTYQTWQSNKTASDLGKVTAERDQAQAANATKDAELNALANAPKDVDDALKRLDEGSA